VENTDNNSDTSLQQAEISGQGKFEAVPVESDTRITFQQQTQIDEYQVLHQSWSWDGIRAESLLFSNPDVTHLSEEQITDLVKQLGLCQADSSTTFKRSESGYTFVNFNFEY